ncbi:hypothetical protein Tco_0245040 [Tanacetum coccineum]
MLWLRRCAELREVTQCDDWVEMLVLYCWRSVDEDFRDFIQELDVVPGWVVAKQKTFEFLKETQAKDDERLRQLEALSRETEAMTCEKCIFIEKLKGNRPF